MTTNAIDSIEQTILLAIHPRLIELNNIWEYVGYTDEEKAVRFQQASTRLEKLFDEILEQENSRRLEMEHEIERKRREVADLCLKLRLPAFLPDRGLSATELMKVLEQKCDELESVKRSRCEEYTRLRAGIIRFERLLNRPNQTRLADFPPLDNLPFENGCSGDHSVKMDGSLVTRIPDENELKRLTEIHSQLDAIYTPLATQYAVLREDIVRIASEVQYTPQCERESELFRSIGLYHLCPSTRKPGTPGVVRRANEPEIDNPHTPDSKPPITDENQPVLDEELLKWLTDLRLKLVKEKARLVGTCEELRAHLISMWSRLDRPKEEQDRFLSEHGGFHPETLDALQDEVDRCQQLKWEQLDTYVSRLRNEAMQLTRACCVAESVLAPPANADSEAVVNHLETLLEQLTRTFQMYKSIFDRIAFYEEQWQALVAVDLRLRDPAIFSNRGGILLKTEKEKKRLVREVQRAEQEVFAEIEQHELKTKTAFHLPDGRTFKEYVATHVLDSRVSRESSRARRSVFSGSNPSTPSDPPGAPS